MRKRINLIVVCLVFYVSMGFCEEPKSNKQITLTLSGAINIAFKNNKDIQIQEQGINVSKAGIMGARSAFMPTLNIDSSYTHNDVVLNASAIPSLSSNKKDPRITTGYKDDNQVAAVVNQTIYNGGANIANFKQAQLNLKSSEETLRAKKLDTEFDAKRLYYGLLLAYEIERIAQDLVDQAILHYEDVKNKYRQGTSSRFDLLQSKVQISILMPELIKAKNNVDLTMVELKKLLGLNINDPVAVSERLQYSLIEIKEGEFLKQAYLNKPEMILDSIGIDINKWGIEMAKAGWRPQITASGNYSYTSNNWGNMFNNRHSNWQAGVSVTVPIFDAWLTRSKVDEAKAKYTQAILTKDNLSDQIAVDIRQACLDLNEAKALIDSQKDNIEEAREALRISIVSYDNGVGTNLDVLDSQVSLAQVQQNLFQGIYDYLMAGAFLDRTRGKSYIVEAKK
ncbi:MAG: TolC family protein [Candidatus Omnitrophica bacterium]|nr:TolC family protein [Candidatus Omnitrophota bacterium]